MRAIIIHAARDLRLDAVEIAAPGAGEVLVRLERGGICGSDLHYYHEGRIGAIVLKQPMTLGHEVAGRVEALGSGVVGLRHGDLVALNPSRACNCCKFCLAGVQQHCLNMRFYGSAMPFPHIQGAFQEKIIAEAVHCVRLPDTVTAGEAALCEPFAVCLHAARRAGNIFGKRILVTGCGPIGALTITAARHAGAAEIVATDVTDTPFALAQNFGADRCIDVTKHGSELAAYATDKGYFDIMFECSGNERALLGAFDVLKPGAVIIQVGLGGSFTLPINTLVAREFELRGTFRFHDEFALAAGLIGSRRVDLRPLISATLPFTSAVEAFELASDRKRAMKVQLAF